MGDPRGEIVVDGKLDEEAWRECPVASTGRLSELQTGRQPIFGTSFKAAWRGGDLYFAVRCEERKGEKPNIAATRDGDQATWYGDLVEILVETESHSYYQIVVNPSGALIDLDRGAPKSGWLRWDSKAEVATQVGDDHWSVEIRIPVVQDENDPLHQVIGRKPTQSLPWHVNVCRQRIRENGSEYSAFAPTAESGFHVPLKFAHFYAGNSHEFDADPSVTDYLIQSRAAADLARRGKHEEALAAYLSLAKEDDATEYQKSAALEQAASCARNRRDFDGAAELADQIPIEAVADTVRMQNLLAGRKSSELIERFGNEDLARWPFWKAGEAYLARGRAYTIAASGDRAEADLQAALELTSDSRTRTSILLGIGINRETILKDDAAALEAYQQIAAQPRNTGSADYFRGVQSAARILTRSGKFDDALDTLRLVEIDKLRGYWRGALFRSLGDTLNAADQNQEALAAYREVLEETAASAGDRKAAEGAIEAIEQRR